MTCGRMLVGQGDDTSDPHCVRPAQHQGGCSPVPIRHDLRVAATKVLWDRRSMLPEHSEELVDDVLDAVLPMLVPDRV